MNPDDPRARLRLWINGKLIDEVWIDASNPDCERHFADALDRHGALALQAHIDGHVSLCEYYDPAKPEDEAYTRIGTDIAGITDPRPLR